jgi:hypothetical protein
MLPWILQTIILSIVFIFLIDHLIIYFKDNLTVPKVKDLIHTPSQKYKYIYDIISNSNKEDIVIKKSSNDEETNVFTYTKEDLLPKPDVETMKNELKNFLKDQLHSNNNNLPLNNSNVTSTDIQSLDLYSNSIPNYASY